MPTRGRVEQFFNCLDDHYKYLANKEKTRFIISCDTNDESMNNDEVRQRFLLYDNLKVVYGESESKIHAVNRDLDGEDFDIIIASSDDMFPEVDGYDDIIRSKMLEHYPDTDGTLWFFDGYNPDVPTLSIMGKRYYDRFGYIYHASYISLWADAEHRELGYKLGKIQKIDDVIIRHKHPDYGLSPRDVVHSQNDQNDHKDRSNFFARRDIGFPK